MFALFALVTFVKKKKLIGVNSASAGKFCKKKNLLAQIVQALVSFWIKKNLNKNNNVYMGPII